MIQGNGGVTGKLPKRILGYILLLSGLLLVLWLFVAARIDYDGTEGRAAETAGGGKQKVTDSLFHNRPLQVARPDEPAEAPFISTGGTLGVLLFLIVLLGAAWLLVRNYRPVHRSYFREYGRHPLGTDQELVILEVNDEIWVLSRTVSGVSLLSRVAKGDWKLPAPSANLSAGNFRETLLSKMYTGRRRG